MNWDSFLRPSSQNQLKIYKRMAGFTFFYFFRGCLRKCICNVLFYSCAWRESHLKQQRGSQKAVNTPRLNGSSGKKENGRRLFRRDCPSGGPSVNDRSIKAFRSSLTLHKDKDRPRNWFLCLENLRYASIRKNRGKQRIDIKPIRVSFLCRISNYLRFVFRPLGEHFFGYYRP